MRKEINSVAVFQAWKYFLGNMMLYLQDKHETQVSFSVNIFFRLIKMLENMTKLVGNWLHIICPMMKKYENIVNLFRWTLFRVIWWKVHNFRTQNNTYNLYPIAHTHSVRADVSFAQLNLNMMAVNHWNLVLVCPPKAM